MTKSKLFSGQSQAARVRANRNSQLSKRANDQARATNSEIDWDRQIASLKAYFAKRNHKKAPK